jgi:hypothetical protein
MTGSRERVARAFAHQVPDRTPLFEIFCSYHPIHWGICGRTIGTDEVMAWDAMADGVAWDELFEAGARAQFQVCRFFGLDMVRLNGVPPRDYPRPLKRGPGRWLRNGVEYVHNPRTQLVEVAHPEEAHAYSRRQSEEEVRGRVEAWDGRPAAEGSAPDPVLVRVQELARAEGLDWVYMGEIGAGTGVAFYPPFLLMWMIEEPELYRRWLEMQKAAAFPRTRDLIAHGCGVIALGGDVSCDKGPFISPACYREFVLPVIQEHVRLVHDAGALAVYTSDGNHWPIAEDFFFRSGVDGYKEVDQAAGMTWPRLIAAGVDRRVCIIGNTDARHTLCHGTREDVRREVTQSLRYGQISPGGHILHNSHSVHEDVRVENYYEAVNTYRAFFGMEPLPAPP